MDELETVLKRLVQAEAADQALHRRDSSLDERVKSHDELARLRAEAAQIRSRLGIEKMTSSTRFHDQGH